MSRIKEKDTFPEMAVRRLVYALGYRYRLHRKDLPGKPDLVFKGRRKVIFVHGCFWHGHKDCNKGSLPKTNSEFWREKIARNIERDQRNIEELNIIGYKSLIVWECQTKDMIRVTQMITDFLENKKSL